MDTSEKRGSSGATDNPARPVARPVQGGGVLELREERAVVGVESVRAGEVQVRRVVETRTEALTVQLTRETLQIEVRPGGPAVRIGDRQVEPGEVLDLVLYDEQPVVSVQPFVTQEVTVSRRRVTETRQVQIELGREVLQVDQSGDLHVAESAERGLPGDPQP